MNEDNTTKELSSELPFTNKVKESVQEVLDLIRERSTSKKGVFPLNDVLKSSLVLLKNTTYSEDYQCLALVRKGVSSSIEIFMSIVDLETKTKILNAIYEKAKEEESTQNSNSDYKAYKDVCLRNGITGLLQNNKDGYLEISVIPLKNVNEKIYCSWRVKHGLFTCESEKEDLCTAVVISQGKYGDIDVFSPNSMVDILKISVGKNPSEEA